MTAKRIVLHRLISVLSQHVSPGDAFAATLGGKGIEADCWKAAGLRPERSWLVERNARAAGILRRSHTEYRHVRELSQLPTQLQRIHGSRAHLDLLHVDLCGTVEPNVTEFTGALPLLMRGKGRILAVTMADQRRNRSTSESVFIRRVCAHIFGSQWEPLWSHLMGIHAQEAQMREHSTTDPEKVAVREVGALLHLLLAFSAVRKNGKRFDARTARYPLTHFLGFRKSGERRLLKLMERGTLVMLPERIERFVYWNSDSGFRMRTFLFRLALLPGPISMREGAERLAELFIRSSHTYVDGDGAESVWHQPVGRRGRVLAPPPGSSGASAPSPGTSPVQAATPDATNVETEVTQIRGRFAPSLGLMNEQALRDFDRLCMLAEEGAAATARMRDWLAQGSSLLDLVSPSTSVVDTTPRAAVSSGFSAPATDDSEDAAHDFFRLRLLRAKKEGEASFALVRRSIIKALGISRRQNGNRVIGGILARANGRFRPAFVERMLKRTSNAEERERLRVELTTL
jgi:hypothetical protein